MRIAWMPDFVGLPCDRRIRDVFAQRRAAFEAVGCVVEEPRDAPDFSDAIEVFHVLRALSFFSQLVAKVKEHRARIRATVLEVVGRGATLTGPRIAEAETKRSRLFARAGEIMEKYEYLVLPVTQVPPCDATTEYVREVEGVKMESYIDWMRSCWYVTVIGHPAISVPGSYTTAGLPLGVQIVGRHHADFEAPQLAFACERATRPLWRRPAGI